MIFQSSRNPFLFLTIQLGLTCPRHYSKYKEDPIPALTSLQPKDQWVNNQMQDSGTSTITEVLNADREKRQCLYRMLIIFANYILIKFA